MRQARNRNKVRIIGGIYRRRPLSFPVAQPLRPTLNCVRETLFNWLGQDLTGLSCLDLFAGSGALGFEAASRGAILSVLVEKSRSIVGCLKANQQQLAAQQVQVIMSDALNYLKHCAQQFDIIFVDPPFDSDLLQSVLPKLQKLLAPGGYVYVETSRWPENMPSWQVVRQDKIGQVYYGLLSRFC